MGSSFYTFDEAVEKLGKSKRSVYDYLRQGLLRREKRDGRTFIPVEDVENLAVDIGHGFPPMNRKTFFQLMARVQKLEQDMSVVRRMTGIQDQPLRPNKEEARGLFMAATQALGAKAWHREEIATWADLFDRMDEVCFDIFADYVNEPLSWAVFYQLCLAMMKYVSQAEDYKTSLIAQHTHKRLDEGRKAIRGTILMWVELGKGGTPDALLRALDDGRGMLLRQLAGKNS
jgi:hypothetical protein